LGFVHNDLLTFRQLPAILSFRIIFKRHTLQEIQVIEMLTGFTSLGIVIVASLLAAWINDHTSIGGHNEAE
jgi:hypothetical protein